MEDREPSLISKSIYKVSKIKSTTTIRKQRALHEATVSELKLHERGDDTVTLPALQCAFFPGGRTTEMTGLFGGPSVLNVVSWPNTHLQAHSVPALFYT